MAPHGRQVGGCCTSTAQHKKYSTTLKKHKSLNINTRDYNTRNTYLLKTNSKISEKIGTKKHRICKNDTEFNAKETTKLIY